MSDDALVEIVIGFSGGVSGQDSETSLIFTSDSIEIINHE